MTDTNTSLLNIQQVPIKELKPATYNPRKWDEKAVSKLTESLKRFGFVDPILANSAPSRKNIVIGGHFRLKVAKDLGYKEVPVVYTNIPNQKKEKELNLRLNRNTGAWDYDLLKEFDVDLLTDIGFSDDDLQAIWSDSIDILDDHDSEDLDPEVIPSSVRRGELFALGNHRLLCGDSTDPESIKLLMGEESVSMIYCDPPYNIGLDYSKGVSTKGKYQGAVNDSLTNDDYEAFIQSTMKNSLSVARPNAHIFYWCDQNYIGLMQKLYSDLNVTNRRVCLWIKNNFNMTPQIAFNKAYEPCVYGTIGKPYLNDRVSNLHEILNRDMDAGNQTITDIIDIFDIWLASRDPVTEYEHPTQKPLDLHEKPIRRCTKPGDAILDLFGGSGSTLLACEQLNRKAFLVEQDPHFCDVIIRRYELMTGVKVKKVASYGD